MALTKEQYNRIMRRIDERRSDAKIMLLKRKEEIAAKIPAYILCGEELLNLNHEEIRARFAGDEGRLKELAKARKELNRTRARLLKEYGYPADYLELPVFCKKCGDTGFLPDREKCSCFKKLEAELVNSESGLPGFLKGADFDHISTKLYDDTAPMQDLPKGSRKLTQKEYMEQIVLPRAAKYIEGFAQGSSHNIFMTGPAGTGKSYLSAAIAGKLMDSLHSCVYISAGELGELFSDAVFARGNTEQVEAKLDSVRNCELLIIDDLGTEFLTELIRAEFFSLLSRRLSMDLSTIISTNMDLNMVESAYGDRVASRIKGGFLVLPFFGPDLRLKVRSQRLKQEKAKSQEG